MIIHGDGDGMVLVNGERTLIVVRYIISVEDIAACIADGLSLWTIFFPIHDDAVERLESLGLDCKELHPYQCRCSRVARACSLFHPQLRLMMDHNSNSNVTVVSCGSALMPDYCSLVAKQWMEGKI